MKFVARVMSIKQRVMFAKHLWKLLVSPLPFTVSVNECEELNNFTTENVPANGEHVHVEHFWTFKKLGRDRVCNAGFLGHLKLFCPSDPGRRRNDVCRSDVGTIPLQGCHPPTSPPRRASPPPPPPPRKSQKIVTGTPLWSTRPARDF